MNDPRAAPVRDRGDRRDILHLEGQRSRGFREDELRVVAKFTLDRGARQRIVIAHLDAEARQMQVAEPARRPVDGVGDEDVIAGARERQQRKRRRGESGRNGQRREAAFDLGDRALQVGDGRQTVQAIRNARMLTACRLFQLGDRFEEDRRRAKHRRVDGPHELSGVAPEVARLRGGPHRFLFPGHAASLVVPRASAARIRATCSGIVSRTSTTTASAGSSSVANWLSSSVAGM